MLGRPDKPSDVAAVAAQTPSGTPARVSRWAALPLIGLLQLYRRLISPLLGPRCRFTPTCSRYALTVLESHGLWRGSWLAAKRVARCHPFHPGGYDPPPPAHDAAKGGAHRSERGGGPVGGVDSARSVGSTAGPDGDPVPM